MRAGVVNMTREFVMLPEFDKQWKAIGFSDRELKMLQEELTVDPEKGDLIRGTGGLRKIRVAFEDRGKSGSARVCYIDFLVSARIYLITAYTKKEKENLTQEERNELKKLTEQLKQMQKRR